MKKNPLVSKIRLETKHNRIEVTPAQAIRWCVAVVFTVATIVFQIAFDQGIMSMSSGDLDLATGAIRLLPSVLLSGLCGIVPAMIAFVSVFIYKWIVQTNIAYAETIILLADIIIYNFVRSGRMRSLKKVSLFFVWFTGLVGPIWGMIIILLDGRRIDEFAGMNTLYTYATIIPGCLTAFLLLYLYFNHTSNKLRHLTGMGLYYASDYENDFKVRNSSKVSRRITQIITMEGIVLGVTAAIFANSLIPDISDNVTRERDQGYLRDYIEDVRSIESQETDSDADLSLNEEIAAQQEQLNNALETVEGDPRFIMNRRGLAFDLKLILLIMCVAVPFVILANYYAQQFIAIPITKMASKMKEFCDAPQDKKEERLTEVHDLGITNKDEIGELYGTIDNMATNITSFVDQVVREQKLEEDLRVAQKASETKSIFLNNMSHEIRTPINAVLGLDEMILREADDEEILGYARDIQTAGKTLLGLINDILDSSKLEVGKMEILPVEYDLASTINDLINMIGIKAKDKGLDLIVNVDEDTPYLLVGDEIRIKQVVTNILSNAVKYTEEGSITLTIGFEKTSDDQMDLKVSVKDTGIGIKPEDIEKLYKPFERIEESRNRNVEGTGLGMTIVKQLLSLMGSDLHVESVYGEGSEFSFAVAQGVVKWDRIGNFTEMYERAKRSQTDYHESFRAPDANILIVDDTQLNLTVATALLKQTLIQVDTAESGFEMLDMIKEKKYDVILLDHRMPQMDGIETLSKMMADKTHLNTDTPVIALTANAISGARETYLDAGFVDYLSKPIDGIRFERLLEFYIPDEKILHEGDEGYGDPGDGFKKVERDEAADHIRTMLLGTTLIDVEGATKTCGSAEILEKALKDFLAAVPAKSQDIERYALEKDYENYTVLVHALKSSARLIGATALSEQAAELETTGDAAKKGDHNAQQKIAEDTPKLLELYRSYFEKLGSMFLGIDDDDIRPQISREDLFEAMAAVKEYALAFDFDSADSVMVMLRDYSIPNEYADAVEAVTQKLADVDQAALLDSLKIFS